MATLEKRSVLCIGAGPAGLTAAYVLSKQGMNVMVLERDPVYVGGISRTVKYKGFHFDIGGHRFFSKSAQIEALWTEILGDDFLNRPRKSRIYYRNRLFDYPLKAFDALLKLGPVETVACVLSYLRARIRPVKEPHNFEEWVANQFGRRLFSIFFETYTEKVWGMKCTEISADWAAQRIKGLSLGRAIWHALKLRQSGKPRGAIVKTLIDSFRYPRRGPGMMWEAAARKIRAAGGEVLLDRDVVSLAYQASERAWLVSARDSEGARHVFKADHVICSAALSELVAMLSPAPSKATVEAAHSLRYRDFLVVALILRDRGMFDDNWIYIHDPTVKVARIQNFKSWSPELVPDPTLNCYGLEYFCFKNDNLWTSPDEQLISMAREELFKLGLAHREDIVDGCVIRQPKAYPVYNDAYQSHIAVIRHAIEHHYPNLHPVGRNGMHKYNNQDHAMMTAMLAARNIIEGRSIYDVWQVNQDAEYHEAGELKETGVVERLVPQRAR